MSGWSQRSEQGAGKSGKKDGRGGDEEIKRDSAGENAMKQTMTFAKMDLFTNKCSRCQHLLQNDLHMETELTALICSSSRPLAKSYHPADNRSLFLPVCHCMEPFHSTACTCVHLNAVSCEHEGPKWVAVIKAANTVGK